MHARAKMDLENGDQRLLRGQELNFTEREHKGAGEMALRGEQQSLGKYHLVEEKALKRIKQFWGNSNEDMETFTELSMGK